MWVSINKRLVCTVYPKKISVNMIFSAVQTKGYNNICMGFNPKGGAWGTLSAPRLWLYRSKIAQIASSYPPQSHKSPSLAVTRYSLWSYLPAAIAARGIWNSYIDFPLGLAATGGLTSGSALPI